jgi:hypothetical protein
VTAGTVRAVHRRAGAGTSRRKARFDGTSPDCSRVGFDLSERTTWRSLVYTGIGAIVAVLILLILLGVLL